MKLAFCLVAALSLPLAGQAQTPSVSEGTETPPTASAMDTSLFYQVLLGELSTQGGESGAGYSLMLNAARKTNDARLYQRAVDIALQSRAGDAALQAARAWKQAQPNSREAGRITLQILVALNRVGDIGDLLAAEIAATPREERSTAIAVIPLGLLRVTDKALAAKVVEQALANFLNQPDTTVAAWTTVGRMRQLADNPKGALEAVHQAQAVNPKAVSPMFLTLELIRPDLPEAESLVRQYLSRPQSEPEVRMAYARTLLEAQRLSEALIQFELLTTQQPDYAPGWLAVGMFQLQTGQLNAAQTGFQHYLDLTATTDNEAAQRGKTEAQLGLSEIAERRGNLVEAGRWLDQIGTPTPRLGLVARRASLLARQGHLDQARTLIQAWPAQTPEDARAKLMTETQLLRDNQQFPAAFDLLAQALVQTPDDTDLLYEQSLIADKLGQFEVMEQLLRQIIALKPDHFNAYNALGYSLAERNLRLDEARQLIQKALSFTPNDPLIQDSLGWVEFRSGHHDEALRILRAAFKARPDADVAAHLGEVLWQMGQRDEALAIWKQGRQLNPDNETITETLKRLRVSL